ncbi:hypothetical protein CDV55_103850 [Aspergillus turcosus]|uniref:Uncharacterized protein n=1 Tax=Aspergillus turcosus TaxID=1245748 RepID=A0A229YP54_9EURO|nr:hypothetical protein CDV55_103850 [Aspergillus turcosus]RLL96933.1 hypothetical protein CFD26_103644 [Aspergillus turcosus]
MRPLKAPDKQEAKPDEVSKECVFKARGGNIPRNQASQRTCLDIVVAARDTMIKVQVRTTVGIFPEAVLGADLQPSTISVINLLHILIERTCNGVLLGSGTVNDTTVVVIREILDDLCHTLCPTNNVASNTQTGICSDDVSADIIRAALLKINIGDIAS